MNAGGIPVSVKYADNSEEGHARLEEGDSSSADFHATRYEWKQLVFSFSIRRVNQGNVHLSSHKVCNSLIPSITV